MIQYIVLRLHNIKMRTTKTSDPKQNKCQGHESVILYVKAGLYKFSKKFRSLLQNLGARREILNDLYVKKENFWIIVLKIWGATMKNLVVWATWHLGLADSCVEVIPTFKHITWRVTGSLAGSVSSYTGFVQGCCQQLRLCTIIRMSNE